MVKAVGESGGYGMLIGPHSTEERSVMRDRIHADPRNYIAQPVLALSTAPCLIDGNIEPRHVDLPPLRALRREGHDRARRLTRVALRKGSLVVNSSQGGGSKRTVRGVQKADELADTTNVGTGTGDARADSLYWMSRYFERADNIARVIDATHSLMLSRVEVATDQRWFRALNAVGLQIEAGNRIRRKPMPPGGRAAGRR